VSRPGKLTHFRPFYENLEQRSLNLTVIIALQTGILDTMLLLIPFIIASIAPPCLRFLKNLALRHLCRHFFRYGDFNQLSEGKAGVKWTAGESLPVNAETSLTHDYFEDTSANMLIFCAQLVHYS